MCQGQRLGCCHNLRNSKPVRAPNILTPAPSSSFTYTLFSRSISLPCALSKTYALLVRQLLWQPARLPPMHGLNSFKELREAKQLVEQEHL